MSKQLSIFSEGMMRAAILNQLQAELTAKEKIIEEQKRSLAVYKGHFTKQLKNKQIMIEDNNTELSIIYKIILVLTGFVLGLIIMLHL